MKNIALTLICLFCFTVFVLGQGLKSHIGKPVPQKLIDSIIGTKSFPEYSGMAFKDFGVVVYSNWEKSSISVITLEEKGILFDYLIIDSKQLEKLFPGADLARAMDEKYEEINGKEELINIIISYHDSNEKDNNEENPEYFTKILKAWTIDKIKLKFIEISTKGLTSYNEGYDA